MKKTFENKKKNYKKMYQIWNSLYYLIFVEIF